MIDLDSLEARIKPLISPKEVIFVSKGWLVAVIKEVRANRATIAALTAENEALRNGATVTRTTTTTSKATVPEKEMADLWSSVDNTFTKMTAVFTRAFGGK